MKAALAHRETLRAAMRGQISFDFRERLMLVVTAVNGCRYCSYFHARQALQAGLQEAELRELLAGDLPQGAPADELPALLFAQHWAEQNGHPDPALTAQLAERYTQETAAAIQAVLRMIRVGNLLGNTWDYILFRLSFGRLGVQAR